MTHRLAVLLFSASPSTTADSTTPPADPSPSTPARETKPPISSRFALTGAYYGETITHPGVAIGSEFYLWENRVYKLIAASKLGVYLHPRSHTAAFLDAELGHRVTARFGLYADVFTGVGYIHTRPWGDIYGRAADGGVEKQFNPGHPHVRFNAALGLGWDLSKNGKAPISVFTRLEVFGEYPFNTTVALHGALMGGVIWRFGKNKRSRS